MGNVLSSTSSGREKNVEDSCENLTMDDNNSSEVAEDENNEVFHDTVDENEERTLNKEKEMEEFRKQLEIKREQRKEILTRHRAEKEKLEISLAEERKSRLLLFERNKMLRELLIKNNIEIPVDLQASADDCEIKDIISNMSEEYEKLKSNNNKLRRDLAETNNSLQNAYSDIADLTLQNSESIKQIRALKDIISVSKTMINLREEQLNKLRDKLNEIEQTLADRESSMLSADLRDEYVRQLQNIRTLRGLYEERARLAEVTRQNLARELEEQKLQNQAEVNKCIELSAKVEELEKSMEALKEAIENKNDQITTCQGETRVLQAEMSAVNKLFSQVLLGYKNKQDLDKLVHRLEENHGLLTHMAEQENGSEASSALPKLLLQLVSQVEEEQDSNENKMTGVSTENNQITEQPTNATAEEIVQNLPKVWRVLMELLSHQSEADTNPTEKVTTCYKSVDTQSGPVLVPSVSQTYIRLKDLIIEKLGLIKEVNRMKQLNSHLETRLGEQERRLCLVTTELSKTWHVVGRLRRHHHQLHTHEKILKYELQQKRKLLNELKEELGYCRDKWEQAREKNTQSEKDWKKLRAEFSSRKTKPNSFTNSGESGYSDEKPSDESSESNDESEYMPEPLIRCKKKLKKSFETIVDSSNDINLAAEREDPVSDLLDVADLPLDNQDTYDNDVISQSDSCNTESLLKNDKVCDETEDEVGEINNDSCAEENADDDTNVLSKEDTGNPNNNLSLQSSDAGLPVINASAILESIKKQNERLAAKDKKLQRLESNSAFLLKKVMATNRIGDEINSTLDQIINRPSTSRQENDNSPHREISEDLLTINDPKNESDSNICQAETLKCKHTNETDESLIKNYMNVEKVEIECKTPVNQTTYSNSGVINNTFKKITDSVNSCIRSEEGSQSTSNNKNKTVEISSLDDIILSEDTQKLQEALNQTNNSATRLIYKDIKLESLGTGCSRNEESLSNEENLSLQVTDNVDFLSSHNTNSDAYCNSETKFTTGQPDQSTLTETDDVHNFPEKDFEVESLDKQAQEPIKQNICSATVDVEEVKTSPKEILENIKRQNERLAQKDARLDSLENGCSQVVQSLSKKIATGNEIIGKLDLLHQESTKANEKSSNKSEYIAGRSEPSTSTEIDHEARFAARDLRLKRLEEQTKSLVSKVNDTTDKGVKIHYKLQELHNIYASDSSRDGTPGDDNEASKDKGTESEDQENSN